MRPGNTQKHNDQGQSDAAKGSDASDAIQFSERMLPPVPFDWGAFAIYVLFLGLFCHVTIGNQGQSTYRLAQFSRDIVGTNEGDGFMEIGTYAEYVEWLEFQFFYGLGNVSYRMDLNTNGTVALVGPPRVRQIRSGSECPGCPGRTERRRAASRRGAAGQRRGRSGGVA